MRGRDNLNRWREREKGMRGREHLNRWREREGEERERVPKEMERED